jgi:hypothetical protein
MQKLKYSTTINAPVRDVWTIMLSDSTYREWTSAFHPGSYYEGGWEKGSEIRFIGTDEKGALGGMNGPTTTLTKAAKALLPRTC